MLGGASVVEGVEGTLAAARAPEEVEGAMEGAVAALSAPVDPEVEAAGRLAEVVRGAPDTLVERCTMSLP